MPLTPEEIDEIGKGPLDKPEEHDAALKAIENAVRGVDKPELAASTTEEAPEGTQTEPPAADATTQPPADGTEEEDDDTPADDASTTTEAQASQEANPSSDELYKIDADFIKQQPQDIQRYLKSIEGDTMSERALRNYVNAQAYIERVKSGQASPAAPAQPAAQAAPGVIKQEGTNLKITQTDLDGVVLQQLKQRYPQAPADPAAFKEWMKDMAFDDPEQVIRIVQEKARLQDEVTRNAVELQTLADTWQNRARTEVQGAVQMFNDRLAAFGLTQKDLGIDLALNQQDENQYLYANVLLTKDGKDLNPEVGQKLMGIPILNKDRIYAKLMELNLDQVIRMAQAKAGAQQVRKGKGVKPAPSLGSMTRTRGPQQPVEDLTETDVDKINIDNLTEADFDKLEKRLRKRVVDSAA